MVSLPRLAACGRGACWPASTGQGQPVAGELGQGRLLASELLGGGGGDPPCGRWRDGRGPPKWLRSRPSALRSSPPPSAAAAGNAQRSPSNRWRERGACSRMHLQAKACTAQPTAQPAAPDAPCCSAPQGAEIITSDGNYMPEGPSTTKYKPTASPHGPRAAAPQHLAPTARRLGAGGEGARAALPRHLRPRCCSVHPRPPQNHHPTGR